MYTKYRLACAERTCSDSSRCTLYLMIVLAKELERSMHERIAIAESACSCVQGSPCKAVQKGFLSLEAKDAHKSNDPSIRGSRWVVVCRYSNVEAASCHLLKIFTRGIASTVRFQYATAVIFRRTFSLSSHYRHIWQSHARTVLWVGALYLCALDPMTWNC